MWKSGWVVCGVLLWGGCALVGFDEESLDSGAAAADSGGSTMDAGAGDGGDVPTGRADGAFPEAGTDARVVDSGAREAGPGDAAAEAGDGEDDGGAECPDAPYCESGFYERCVDGQLHVDDCLAKAGPCEVGSCDPEKGCLITHMDNGAACEDGLFCSVEDSCLDGVCQAGMARDCAALNRPCAAGVCDDALGSCTTTPINQGALCDNTGLTCDEGRCASGDLCAVDGCSLTCPEESSPCDFTCNGQMSCNFVCDVGATCDFDCSGAGSACSVTCNAGSTCTVSCATADDCAGVICASTAECKLDCQSGVCPDPVSAS